jgi:hypothetical protein
MQTVVVLKQHKSENLGERDVTDDTILSELSLNTLKRLHVQEGRNVKHANLK